jgi:chromosomal replication initiation ATPase DnaA
MFQFDELSIMKYLESIGYESVSCLGERLVKDPLTHQTIPLERLLQKIVETKSTRFLLSEICKENVQECFKTKSGFPRLKDILRVTSFVCDIPVENIVGRSRISSVCEARQLYCFVSASITSRSHSQIGKIINRNKCTVHHSIETIKHFIEYYLPVKQLYNNILNEIEMGYTV